MTSCSGKSLTSFYVLTATLVNACLKPIVTRLRSRPLLFNVSCYESKLLKHSISVAPLKVPNSKLYYSDKVIRNA